MLRRFAFPHLRGGGALILGRAGQAIHYRSTLARAQLRSGHRLSAWLRFRVSMQAQKSPGSNWTLQDWQTGPSSSSTKFSVCLLIIKSRASAQPYHALFVLSGSNEIEDFSDPFLLKQQKAKKKGLLENHVTFQVDS